jgi:hypothetical protein
MTISLIESSFVSGICTRKVMMPQHHIHLPLCARVSMILSAFLLAAVPLSAGEPMPRMLTTKLSHVDQSYPTWVSASTATLADGSLDPALFHPILWRQLQGLLNVPVDPELGCRPVGEVIQSWLAPPDTSSLAATFKSSQRVLRARVVDRDFGFDRGTPGQLFRIERLETFKGAEDLSTLYFFIPVGRFQAGNSEICKSDYRFPHIPTVGEEVVLLIPDAAEGDPLLDLTFDAGLIVLRDEKPLAAKRFEKQPEILRSRAALLTELGRLSKGKLP